MSLLLSSPWLRPTPTAFERDVEDSHSATFPYFMGPLIQFLLRVLSDISQTISLTHLVRRHGTTMPTDPIFL